jgi:hypothetical protein
VQSKGNVLFSGLKRLLGCSIHFYKYGSILWLEDGYLYLRLRKMSHTIYSAKFEQTIIHQHVHLRRTKGRRGRDRMVVGFTTYATSAYHQWCCEFEILTRARCTKLCYTVCQWLAFVNKYSTRLQQINGI